jgi:hypothetical protein
LEGWTLYCHLNRAVIERGTVAAEAEYRQRTKYVVLSILHTNLFLWQLMETYGALGDAAYSVIEDIGKRLVSATLEPRSTKLLHQRLSVAIRYMAM